VPITKVPRQSTLPSGEGAQSESPELERLKIVRELTGRQRDRLFGYHSYLDVIAEDTAVGPAR
jgi:hypothetical protein